MNKCWGCGEPILANHSWYEDVLGFRWHARCFFDYSDGESDAELL